MHAKHTNLGTGLILRFGLALLAGLAVGCTVNSTNSGGGGYSGGAVGTVCNNQTQGEGCMASGTQHSRMICDPASNTWQVLGACVAGQYCVENNNPAAPGKKITACQAAQRTPVDAGTTDAGPAPTDAGPAAPVCGNGICETPENTVTCPADCKANGPICGDGKCVAPETTATCPADCKVAAPVCGDGKCETPETAESCVKDCGKPAADSCVGRCGKFTDGAPCNCDADCAKYNDCCKDYQAVCGGSCTPNCADKQCGDNGCGGSCGSCTGGKVCSNFVCKAGSTSSVCPNGKCEDGETISSCPQDCKTDCFGDFTLGSTFYKSQDTSQLGQACNPKGAPKNCPDGLWITFGDTGDCICIANCSAFQGIKPGDNCTTSGTWKCLKIKATNSSANSATACVPTKWNLCTAD